MVSPTHYSSVRCSKNKYHCVSVRTREASVLSECDIVVDVGGVYDPALHRYDHHQRLNFGGGGANCCYVTRGECMGRNIVLPSEPDIFL